VSEVWIVNASPLILLGKVGRIDLISRLGARIAVPQGVAEELRAGPAADPARAWIEGPGAESVASVQRTDPLVATWDLGLGESHVLTLCRMTPDAEAILDDRAARNCAAALGIPVRGTLALIALAKRRGVIAEARPLFDALRNQGIRVDDALIEAALRLAGE
jgi:predicted nucleic acid-binding protein